MLPLQLKSCFAHYKVWAKNEEVSTESSLRLRRWALPTARSRGLIADEPTQHILPARALELGSEFGMAVKSLRGCYELTQKWLTNAEN